MKLTPTQREKLLEIAIRADIASVQDNSYEDCYDMFYYGFAPYKDLSDDELIDQVAEFELIEDFILEDWLKANK